MFPGTSGFRDKLNSVNMSSLLVFSFLALTTALVPQSKPEVQELSRRSILAVPLLTPLVPLAVTARGRGTQEAVFQRYQPRIREYGEFLKGDLAKIIDSGDWAALKAETAADMSKKGSVGRLYNGESAMFLWAASFSETSKTKKTKDMDAQIDILTASRETLTSVAQKALGEAPKTGGFFGIGAKQDPPPPTAVSQKQAKQAVIDAVKAYNVYVTINNLGIPFDIQPLVTI